MSALLAPRAVLWVVNQTLPFSKKWNVGVWGAGRVSLAHQQPCRLIRVTPAPVALPAPRDAELQLQGQPARVREPPAPGSQPDQRGWPTGAEHISIHKESLPKTRLLWGAEQSPQAHPHFHPTELCEQTQHSQSWRQDVPGRTDFAVFSPSFNNQFPWLQWHQPLFTLLWKKQQHRGGFQFPTGVSVLDTVSQPGRIINLFSRKLSSQGWKSWDAEGQEI